VHALIFHSRVSTATVEKVRTKRKVIPVIGVEAYRVMRHR
jgi:hypothetical protein